MSNKTTNCPHCGLLLELDGEVRFCWKCNGDLSAPPAAKPQPEANTSALPLSESETAAVPPPFTPVEPKRIPVSEETSVEPLDHIRPAARMVSIPSPSAYTSSIPAPQPSEEDPRCFDTDCEHLSVSYNVSKVFVEGFTVPFEFRITPKKQGVADLFIEIRHQSTIIAREEPAEFLKPGRTVNAHLSFRAPTGLQGEVPFEIYFGYKLDEHEHYYVVRKMHRCFRAKERAQTVINELKIELKNTSQTGHASDPHVHQQINGLDALCPRPDDPAEEFKYISLPPIWESLSLFLCQYKPSARTGFNPKKNLAAPTANAVRERVTLRIGSTLIHLLSPKSVQLGRHRTCDIVTRVMDDDGHAQEEATKAISRFHCRIEAQEDQCVVMDKGWDQEKHQLCHSAHGVFVDGRRVEHGGLAQLPTNVPFQLSLGSASFDDPNVFAFEGRVWTRTKVAAITPPCESDDSPRDLSCLVLARKHGPAEIFVMLWRLFSLELVEPSLASFCVCRCREAFLVKTAGHCEWLVPGRDFSLGDRKVTVEKFRQAGL